MSSLQTGGRSVASISLILFAATAIVAALQDPAPRTVWGGIYTDKQAQRGAQVFKTECSYCHQDDLSGGFFDNGAGRAPALAGPRAFDSSFTERWKDTTLAEMVATVASTMPQQKPASLTVQAYVDVVAFMLSKNNVPAGSAELPIDVDALGQILITQKN